MQPIKCQHSSQIIPHIRISYNQYKPTQKQVNQIDFVPTISLLFGFPIPKNNLGVVINDLTNVSYNNELQSLRYKLRSYQLNADQLMIICKKNIASGR